MDQMITPLPRGSSTPALRAAPAWPVQMDHGYRGLFSAVIVRALRDAAVEAAADPTKAAAVFDRLRGWLLSKDGREVAELAGFEMLPRLADGLVAKARELMADEHRHERKPRKFEIRECKTARATVTIKPAPVIAHRAAPGAYASEVTRLKEKLAEHMRQLRAVKGAR